MGASLTEQDAEMKLFTSSAVVAIIWTFGATKVQGRVHSCLSYTYPHLDFEFQTVLLHLQHATIHTFVQHIHMLQYYTGNQKQIHTPGYVFQGWDVSRYSLGRACIEAIFWVGVGLGEPIFVYLGYKRHFFLILKIL